MTIHELPALPLPFPADDAAMYSKMLVAVDESEGAQHALNQVLPLAASEKSDTVLASVVPSYTGDLRRMGDSSILDSLQQQYAETLERAGEPPASKDLLLISMN